MIVWINGPFGVGKTTLAHALNAMLPNSIVFDPEMIGSFVQWMEPLPPGGDFQDRAIWRTMTASSIRLVHRTRGGTIIVPMTLVNPAYLEEIHGRISRDERDIVHVFLEADAATIRERIERDTVETGAREWRLGPLERCLSARLSLPESTVVVDATSNSPEELAGLIAGIVAERAGARARR